MRRIDGLYLKYPFYGSRKMVLSLKQQGIHVCRDRIRRLMKLMGIAAIYQKPNTSQKNSEHKIYPYLLKDLTIDRPNQVWATDITYVPMAKGFMYLVAVIDWYSRKVLSWRLSNSLDRYFCIESLKEALAKHPNPDIFNTDQGCQFTSSTFTKVLKDQGIHISMDGKGRWRDNVMIERLWRSYKYEYLYLTEVDSVKNLQKGTADWIEFYNNKRPHATFNGQTPHQVYTQSSSKRMITKAA
jgi:putative transposase